MTFKGTINWDVTVQSMETRMHALLTRLPRWKRFAFSSLKALPTHFILKGIRGTGKTTLLLQLAEEWIREGRKVIYLSADHPATPPHLWELVERLAVKGYEVVIVDEVSYLPSWQRDAKAIVDDGLVEQLILSSSSAFSLERARVDLSRRFLLRELRPFTLREYVAFSTGKELPPISLEELLKDWRAFLHYPYITLEEFMLRTLPFYNDPSYEEKLGAILSKMLTSDLLEWPMTTTIMSYARPLFEYLALAKGNEVSYSSLSNALGISKGSVVTLLQSMVEMGLLIEIPPCARGKGRLAKRRFAVAPPFRAFLLRAYGVADKGTLREDFFAHHLRPLCYSDVGDFRYGDYLFEVGGYSKTRAQLRGEEGFVVSDSPMPKEGIPLHLFGYLSLSSSH